MTPATNPSPCNLYVSQVPRSNKAITTTMRALCLTGLGGPDRLDLIEIAEPDPPAPDQVRVGIRAVALNHLDLMVARGIEAIPITVFPRVVGCDGAGVVLETGAAVTHVAVGDRVVINAGTSCGKCEACRERREVFCRGFGVLGEHHPGLAAEQVVVPAINVQRLEGDWSWAEAAAFTLTTLTAWRMLTTRAAVQSGEAVLIWGIGGGVALQALQIARHLGARVAVTSGDDAKLARAAELGAELVLDHSDPTLDIPRAVKQHFGHGADVIVDSVGTATWPRSLKALRPGGRLVACGATSGHDIELDLRRLFWFQWSLLGSTMGTSTEFAAVTALGNQGLLRPVVDTVMPLTNGRDAYRRLESGHQFGKLVLEVST
ncbi:MAG TPA: zinc-binding dehydrogenase [Gemmatimonadales bacterium]|nr:zinc-binding dehydrogenase [Gemmatimonadales bacterium]